MGNCSTSALPMNLDEEYNTFVETCCEVTPEMYTTYYELCYIFSIFLQRHVMHRLSETQPNGTGLQEWGNIVSMNYIDGLCNIGKLVRYGEFDETALILNIRVRRLPVPKKTWVEI